ncbi:DUF397 domain-containing protein [Streptomyces cyaneochromogenes]|uniref:DUF397 domain-containing protein n=1 Tax=Streptomyces cyaneochromogenes TaxID=2496836 RepID=A0A3Q9ESF1_9ACTN|nr:DUF397 domain-containing protein [Streptomyces cyaneochromogenes]AZQ34923.1 DUF397 domain-containing protein [Streptomyces cyaneochromogenes]
MTDRSIPNAGLLSGWRKSSHSDDNAGSCLEVLDNHPSGVPVRDSKAPYGPALLFSAANWSAFVTAVKESQR